jgi:hypothetical protein
MLPDFLLRCVVCGTEAVWDTEALPPVGTPEIGHPVLWSCGFCGQHQRHIVEDLFVMVDKLHHEICVAMEMDRVTVDRVMTQMYRYRQRQREDHPFREPDPAEEVEEIAGATGIPQELVAEISVVEATWMLQRGYFPRIVPEP